MANIHNLFKIGKSGMLIFKRRPWCYYYGTVTSVDITNMFSYLNGLVVVTMKAYYPFARGIPHIKDNKEHLLYSLPEDPYHDEIMLNTGMLDKDIAPQTSFDSDVPSSCVLFNPGTERAKLGLVISGADSVIISNLTTGQSCRYQALSDDIDYIYTDGINGKTVAVKGSNKQIGFLYHDYGFIELEPSFPIRRDVYCTAAGKQVQTTNILYSNDIEKEWYIGKYIYISDKWYKILSCDKHSLTLKDTITTEITSPTRTTIALMNEISIDPAGSISRISFIYKPTYA